MFIDWKHQVLFFTPHRPNSPFNRLVILAVQILLVWPGLNLFPPGEAISTLADRNAKPATTITTPPSLPTSTQATHFFETSPLSFESNLGQFDPQIRFLAQGPGYSFMLGEHKAVFAFQDRQTAKETATAKLPALVELSLVGANPAPQLEGLTEQAAKSHYFTGNDPSKWQANVPHFSRVLYKEIYPGVDMVYYSNNQNQLEYDFNLAPGADPANLKLEFSGASGLELNAQGDLVIALPGGNLIQPSPQIYQEKDGVRKTIQGKYRLSGALNNRVSFDLKDYDATLPLVIDPTINYASYFGGGTEDFGNGIAVDSSGNTYITGNTTSTNFPNLNGTYPNYGGGTGAGDAFISKFSPGGTLLYSTYLGGSGDDSGAAIALDQSGNFYVTGTTNSPNFPILNGAYTSFGGGTGSGDAFVSKFNSSGTLQYSTYLGGSNDETARGIAVDGSGNAYVTGTTNGNNNSDNFPVVNARQASFGGGSNDAYVTKFNSSGAVVYSSYLGGNGSELSGGIAVDANGNTYITGGTTSTNFVIMNPYQATPRGARDIFVTKLTGSGALAYSTYLGGSGEDNASGIAIDSDGNFYVTGTTISNDFPTKNAYHLSFGDGFEHVFVTKFNSGGTLGYSTYLGGNITDFAGGIAVDFGGNAYVTGNTYSNDFPVLHPTQNTTGGDSDIFLTQFNADGTLGFSTYLGGSNADFGTAVAVDTNGNAYLTGYTASTNFPVVSAYQATTAGGNDAIIAKLNIIIVVNDNTQSSLQTALTQASTNGGGTVAFSPSVTTAVTLTGNLTIPANVNLTGRSCGPTHAQVQLTGSGNLVLSGNNIVTGLKLQGMKLTNLNNSNTGNKVKCSTVTK